MYWYAAIHDDPYDHAFGFLPLDCTGCLVGGVLMNISQGVGSNIALKKTSLGHTKVLSMIKPEEARIRYAIELEDKGEHLRILHTPGFLNIDCGCGYDMPIKALACLRLEDLVEHYT